MTFWMMTAALLASAQDTNIEVEVVEAAPQRHVMVMQIARTREETAAKAGERFDARDADGSGYLEGDEIHALGMTMPHVAMVDGEMKLPRVAMRHREAMDPDKMFDKIDTDGNGWIGRDEFEAHHKDHGAMGGHAMPKVMMRHKRGEGHEAGKEGERHVVINRFVTEDGETQTEDVIVKKLGEGETLELEGENSKQRVFVRRMGDGGSWTNDEGRKLALERIEKMVAQQSEDADGDGRVSREEAIAKALERFDAMDKDGDGKLGEDERMHVFKRVVERVETKD